MNITTVTKLAEKHDGITEQSIRWAIFNAKKNGLEESGAIFRKNRRIFLVEERYVAWLSEGAISSKGAAA